MANEQAIKRQRIAGRKIATDLLEGITIHRFFLRPRTMQDNTRIDNPSGTGINKTKLPVLLYCTKKAKSKDPKRLKAFSEGNADKATQVI